MTGSPGSDDVARAWTGGSELHDPAGSPLWSQPRFPGGKISTVYTTVSTTHTATRVLIAAGTSTKNAGGEVSVLMIMLRCMGSMRLNTADDQDPQRACCWTTLSTLPSGARTKKRVTPHASVVRGCTISYPRSCAWR
jgi:hypothetical protein